MSQEEVTRGNASIYEVPIHTSGGDAVRGDKVADDKIQGDKVGRDKIVYTRSKVNELDDFLQKSVSRFETRMFQLLRPQPQPQHPYKFLYSFKIEDRDIFYGRETAAHELYQAILKDQLTILHAHSGAGKTSLLNAGLSPKLIESGRLPVYARAYEDPVAAIKQAVIPPSLGPWPELFEELDLDEFLGLACIHLSRQVKELVIILDQFEEFFIFPPEDAVRQPFITDLAACINDKNLPIRFVVAIRKDYYSDLAELKDNIPTIFFNEYRLNHMTRKEAESAVVGPLAYLNNNINYEQNLLDNLLDELFRGGVELPHLQIICNRLYAAAGNGDRRITSSLYKKLGGTEGILGSYLTTELQKLPGRQSEIAREILKELVSSESTKRVLPYQSLAGRIKVEKPILDETLTRLVNARLLHRWETAGTISYEMAHEYLIAEIGRWIDQSDLVFKHAEELLARETTTWRIHGTLIPVERLALLLPHCEKFKDNDNDAQLALYLSALKHRSEEVRIWAVEALGQLGDRRVVEPLINILENNYSVIRSRATTALGQLGRPAIAPLLAALRDEKIQVRTGAIEALTQLGELALEPLKTALGDEDDRVRSSAATVLGQLGDNRAVEPLMAALNDKDGPVRYTAARALAKLRDSRAVEPLINVLSDEDWRVRDRAAKALGLLGDTRAIAPLIVTLGDPDGRVQDRATEALGNLGESTLEPLIFALGNENKRVRCHAAQLLGQLGSRRAAEPLIFLLGDEDENVRSQAIEALSQLGGDQTVELLKDTLKDTREYVRHAAVHTLSRLGIMEIELLIAALKDKDWSVRRSAAVALGQLGDTRAVEPLINALMDCDWRVRAGAAVSLGQFGEQAVTSLINAINFKAISFNKSTAVALRIIGTPEALAPLKEYGFGD
jgi:HEAT repeat protein